MLKAVKEKKTFGAPEANPLWATLTTELKLVTLSYTRSDYTLRTWPCKVLPLLV